MPTGLGDEQLWLCPSLDNVTPFDDLSSQGNNGTAQGGLSTIADTGSGGSYAYDLDGTNDYINCGDVCNFTSQISISSWVKSDSLAAKNTIVQKRFTNNIESYNLRLETDGELNFYAYSSVGGDSGVLGLTAGDVTTGSWYHVVGSFDGTKWQTFVNGIKISESIDSQGPYSNASELSIGASRQNLSTLQYFNGLVDDVRIYDRAITQAEITHLASQRGVLGTPNNCGIITDLTYWSDLDDGTSATLADDNGGSDVLTRNGGATDATGSPRSSGCVNYSNVRTNYHTLNGGADVAAPPSEYSVSVWSYFSSASPIYGNWVDNQRDASTGDHWQIFRWNTGNIAVYELGIGSTDRSVEVSSSLGQWYHISFSRTDAALSVYVNGSLVGTDTSNITQNTSASPIALGTAAWDQGNTNFHNNGRQWAFGMWDRELSASEHSQLYQSGQGLLYSEICPTATTQYNAFVTHAFRQLFQTRLR